MGSIGSNQGLQGLLGFPLRTQMIDHRPVDLPVQGDIQAMRAQRLDPIEIGQIHLPQGLDLFRTEFHVAQGSLIALRQATDGIHQHGGDQVGLFRALHASTPRLPVPTLRPSDGFADRSPSDSAGRSSPVHRVVARDDSRYARDPGSRYS